MNAYCKYLVFGLIALAVFLGGCKKDKYLTDPSAVLTFSTDTLTFDTVFTRLGSTTGFFKAYNPNDRPVLISDIRLANGKNSQYRINVDGLPADTAVNISIDPKDSVYIFVEVTVDPIDQTAPFIVGDDVLFRTNGEEQKVHLRAWGQDAHFHYGEVITTNTTWNNDKPHVVIGKTDSEGDFVPGVLVEQGSLTITPGTQVHFFSNAGLFVGENGNLNIQGSKSDSIVLQGHRLESFYDDLPGQWLGIFIFRGSTGNEIRHTVLTESTFGLTAGVLDNCDLTLFTDATRPDVLIDRCVFKNNFNNSIFAFNATLNATNSLFYNSVDNLIVLGLGGQYNFDHCTMANFGSVAVAHQSENLLISNFAEGTCEGQAIGVIGNLNATFTNSIIYGTLDEEISLNIDSSFVGSNEITYLFDHCLVKTELNTNNAQFVAPIKNTDPLFSNASNGGFELSETSPCLDYSSSGLSIDLCDRARPIGAGFDLGALERQ